jgi:hypothetical protein
MKEQINMNVSLKDTTPVTCDECGNEVFIEGVMLKKISKFIAGTTSDALMPIPVFICSNPSCHHLNDSFRPKDKVIQ